MDMKWQKTISCIQHPSVHHLMILHVPLSGLLFIFMGTCALSCRSLGLFGHNQTSIAPAPIRSVYESSKVKTDSLENACLTVVMVQSHDNISKIHLI